MGPNGLRLGSLLAHHRPLLRPKREEAFFIIETVGCGQLWLEDDSVIEYFFANLEEGSITSYCARLCKE